MRRIVAIILAVAAIGATTWYFIERNRNRAMIDDIAKLVGSVGDPSKKIISVRTTAATLNQLDHPNFYLFLDASDVSAILKQQSEKGIPINNADGFTRLAIKPGIVHFGKAQIGLTFDVDAELKNLPVSFSGTAVVTSALALNGSKADINPLLAKIDLTKVNYKRTTERRAVVDAVASAVNWILTMLSTVVQTYSVPVNIGITKAFDLQTLLSAIKEVHDVSAPTIPLNLSITSGAVLLDESGVSFLASLVDVSPDLYAATLQQLKDIAKAGQPNVACPECQMKMKSVPIPGLPSGHFDVPDMDSYFQCLREKQACELKKKVGANTSEPTTHLTPLQAYVLQQLKTSPNVDDQQLYALLSNLLKPSLSLEVTPGNVTEEKFDQEFAAVESKFAGARTEVEDDASLPKSRTLAAVRRDFLAQTITAATAGLNIRASLAVPASDQSYDQTIRTDAAPNLNCANQRSCPSDFKYEGWNPPGCPGSCTHLECFLGVCTEVPDITLCAQKASCEASKEGQRLDYERRKAQAQAQFALAKLDCERLKATETLGCNINQQWLNATQNMDLGNVKGSAHIGASNGTVTIKAIKLTSDLKDVQVVFDVTAHSQVDTAFTFTPLNVGHIACVAQWSGKVSAGITLNESDFVLAAHLSPTGSPDDNGPYFATDEASVNVKSNPPLGIALLSQNPQMALACPVPAALLIGLAGAAPPLGLVVDIKLLLNDDIKINIPSQKLPLTISLGDTQDQPIQLDPKVKVGSKSVFVLGSAK